MNVRGIPVPVILGDALVAGSLCGLLVILAIAVLLKGYWGTAAALVIVMEIMWVAGAWDDRRGDERPRGFKGHLGAARARSLTGGVVKIGAGAVAGLAASALLSTRGASPGAHVVECVALVALSANLINLLDRAPGRAAKSALLVGVPLGFAGEASWAAPAAAVLGALLYCLLPDLRERAMLGDAGANPLGAVIGVGLIQSLTEPGRLVAIAILLALNLASERWSFSRAIEATPPLRWFDGLGRKDEVASK